VFALMIKDLESNEAYALGTDINVTLRNFNTTSYAE